MLLLKAYIFYYDIYIIKAKKAKENVSKLDNKL